MATTAKLVAGAVANWTSIMSTELNALASGNAIRSATAIDNSSAGDMFIEFSFTTGGSVTGTLSPFLGLYIYEENGDGSFGDGRYAVGVGGPPPQSFFRGAIGTLLTGAQTYRGTFQRPDGMGSLISLTLGRISPLVHNGLGVALAATTNVLYYRTRNLQYV